MENFAKITFGICTYNRKKIVEKSAASLKKIKGIENIKIVVFDDCSDEYDVNFLRSIFPISAKIIRQEKNNGADKNTSIMYEYFLKSDDEWLFNADSDLIYRTDILDAIKYYMNKSHGFMSFFNSINHRTIGRNGCFVKKDSVGAAGCLLNRDVVKIILENIKYRNIGFDVGFSKLLRSKGYYLNTTEKSFVQHIGVSGYNSRDINFDYGENFWIQNMYNADSIEQTFEQYVKSVNAFRQKTSWKIFYFFISIPRRIKRIVSNLHYLIKQF